MVTRGWKRHLAGHNGLRIRARRRSDRARRLSLECLEQRQLLAADFPGWQNLLVPADVNNDGIVAPVDALLVVHELRQMGARRLDLPAAAGSLLVEGGVQPLVEGEGLSRAYIDVNGDNCLSPVDAFLVVSQLRAEGQTDLVGFRLETADMAGNPISSVLQGQSFVLNVYVQDIRPETVADRGVFQAYLDVDYSSALVTALGPVTYGDAYQEDTAGSLATPGLLDEAGGAQTGYGLDPPGPLGAGEFLLLSVPFQAVAAGTATFTSDPADLAISHEVILFEPITTVPNQDIVFGTTSLTIQAGPVIAVPDAFTVDEDSSDNYFDVLDNDQINTAGSLVIVGVGSTDHGGMVVNNGDHLLYAPAANFIGTESFTYTIDDGLGNTDEATVVVTVLNANNDPPVAEDDGGAGFTTDANTAFTTANVLANDTDLDGDPLSVSALDTSGTKGLVTSNNDGTFDYDPDGQFTSLGAGQTTTDIFGYTADDGNGGTDTATVTVTVTGLNDVPTAEDATFTTTEDAPLGGSLASKAHDPDDNDTLTFSGPSTSSWGAVVGVTADGTFSYNPVAVAAFQALVPGGSLADTFSYTVTDGSGATASGTVTINVSGVNDDPTANDDNFSGILENSSGNVLNVLANDSITPDVGETLTITSVGPTSAGGTIVNEGSQLSYTPVAGFVGTETFSYTIGDSHGGTDQATVTVSVGIRPEQVLFRLETTDMAGNTISNIEQGQPFILNVYVQDNRPDTFLYRGVFQAYLDVTFNSGLVTTFGPFSYGDTYQEETSGGLATPDLLDEAGGTQTGYGLDPPGPLGPGEFLLFSIPFEATAVGTVTFISDPADLAIYHDVTLFEPVTTVANEDIFFGTTALTIHVGAVVAVVDPFTVNEDTSDNYLDVLANDLMSSGGTLAVVSVGSTDHGGTVVNNGDHLLYTPAHDFIGTETFAYTIGDGLGHTDEGTVVVTVLNANNDAPVAHNDGGTGFTTNARTTLKTANVLANDTDPDGDVLSVSAFSATGTKGLVTSNGDGTFNYNPNGKFDYLDFGQQATDTFTYTASDAHGKFSTATVTITVIGAPSGPGDVTGLVYADVDNDGVKDDVERIIAGVEIRLEGTDVYGTPVSLSAWSDAQGQYRFANVTPGSYELIEVQPAFFVDGIDTVNGVPYTGPNDRITITPQTNLAAGLDVCFGERSLHPTFLSVSDAINTALRQGIVIGYDAQWNMLWFSPLNGWDDVTAIDTAFSDSGLTCNLGVSVSTDLTIDHQFAVPTAPAQERFRVMGTTAQGRVVQFIGTMEQFLNPESGLIPEGEGFSSEELIDAVFAALGQ